MSKGSVGEKDREMAKYMKAHPGRFPDSYMRPWQGEGAGMRAMARQMGAVPNDSAAWHHAMVSGVIFARLGLGSFGVPDDLLERKRAAL